MNQDCKNKIVEFELLEDKEDGSFFIKTDIEGIKILCKYLDEYAKKELNCNFHEDYAEAPH